MDLGKLAMLEVITINRLQAHTPRSQIWPKYKLITASCLFKCDLCDAGYVGYAKGHLHKRVERHRQKASSIYKHYSKEHKVGVALKDMCSYVAAKK